MIMPTTVWRWRENLQTYSNFPTFEQAQVYEDLGAAGKMLVYAFYCSYIRQKENLRERPVIDEKDVMIPTREGACIAVRVYRPEGSGLFPTLYATSPYRYDNNGLAPSPMFRWRETGPIAWFVEQGYAYVHSDIRGTGMSEGEWGLLDRKEQEAHYDVIEWIASQPWSNGKVGGIGQSYYCMSQWFMGIQKPPHLVCLGAYDGMSNPYVAAAYSGGIEKSWLSTWFDSSVRIANLFPANGAKPRALPRDIGFEAMMHPLYDDYWRERAALEHIEEIEVPVFSVACWAKQELHLATHLQAHDRLKCPKKLFISATPTNLTSVMDFNTPAFQEEVMLPFYDYYLKGKKKTSYETRPAVEWGVRNAGKRRSAETWPPPGTEIRRFYLDGGHSGSVTSLNDGTLKGSADAVDGGSTSYSYPDPEWALGIATAGPGLPDPVRRILTFTSEPLDADMEMAGNGKLTLFVSTTGNDTDFIVRVSEQLQRSLEVRKAGDQPTAVIVTKGWLRASHCCSRDPVHSSEEWPVYTHSSQEFLTPGEVCQIDIPLNQMGYLFKKGNRVRVEIANHDSPVTDKHFNHFYKPSKIGTDTIRHDRRNPSCLSLQVLPAGA